MADLLGKIKGKIDKGISTVNVKSKKIIETQKTKLQISELEAEKKNLFLEVGKLAHLVITSSNSEEIISAQKSNEPKKSKDLKPDKWEQVVLGVLSNICEGKLDNILFENTEEEFKITAKALSAEVQKSLPKSEQKGQNLQWLGRVIGKFGITSRKYSKRINRERETVYEFHKQKTMAALNQVENIDKKKKKTKPSSDYQNQILLKSAEIQKLDTRISQLEDILSKASTQ